MIDLFTTAMSNVSPVTYCHCDDSFGIDTGIFMKNSKSPSSNSLSLALEKLDSAVDALDKVVDVQLEREEGLAAVESEVQRMGADRNRLAESLDGAEAKSQRLENANREVSRRLVDAMESIRSVLEKQ